MLETQRKAVKRGIDHGAAPTRYILRLTADIEESGDGVEWIRVEIGYYDNPIDAFQSLPSLAYLRKIHFSRLSPRQTDRYAAKLGVEIANPLFEHRIR